MIDPHYDCTITTEDSDNGPIYHRETIHISVTTEMPLTLRNNLIKLRDKGYQVKSRGLEYKIIVPLGYEVVDTIHHLLYPTGRMDKQPYTGEDPR